MRVTLWRISADILIYLCLFILADEKLVDRIISSFFVAMIMTVLCLFDL